MIFTNMLESGVTPKTTATNFAKSLVVQSIASGELCLELAVNFVNECLKMIGLNYTITVDQLEKDGDYNWPENMRILYSIKSSVFAPFENFLSELCTAVVEEQEKHEAVIVENELDEVKSEASECPVDWLMQLMAVWCSVYKHLLEHECKIKRKLIEPVARINYNLLVGMHELRKLYRSERPVMDLICDRLYDSAIQGIFYTNSHNTITKGLLNVLEGDFDLFRQHSANSFNFYYQAFLTKGQTSTHLLVYNCLKKMLLTHSADRNRTTSHLSPKFVILAGFLIQPNMQKVYFTTLKLEDTMTVVVAALQFLDVLQSKILSLDCFSQDFIDSILMHVFDKHKRIANLAAQVAMSMMRRKLHDDVIIKYLIDFYLKQKNTPEYMPQYVHALWLHFPYMTSVGVYLKIIIDENSVELVVCSTCHMLLAVHEEMVKDFEKYKETIANLLQILPNTLKKLERIPTIALLLQIFGNTDLKKLQKYSDSFKEILIIYEKYIVQTFNKDTYFEFPFYFNLIAQLTRCLFFTNGWYRLEAVSVASVQLFARYERQLNLLEAHGKTAPSLLMRIYCQNLAKLNVLLNSKYDCIDSVLRMCKCLRKRLIDTQQIYKFAEATTSFIDVYAIEAITGCLVKLSNQVPSYQRKLWFTEQALDLEKHFIDTLSKIENLKTKMSFFRIKAIFNSLIRLYCTFTRSSLLCCLSMNKQTYHLLVQTLIHININSQNLNVKGNEETQVQPQRIHEYQQSMFRHFIELHKRVDVDVGTSANVAWKLCIYYSLPTHKFNDELAALLQALATHCFRIYLHIAPLMAFNLYKLQPALTDREILRATKAQNKCIDRVLHVESPTIIKAHIVLTVIQIISKYLSVLELNAGVNRLEALKHLPVFVDNVQLHAIAVGYIRTEAKACERFPLTNKETKCLKTFLNAFKRYPDSTESPNC